MKKFTFLVIMALLSTSVFSQYYYNLFDEVYQNPGGLNTDNEYPAGGGMSPGWTVASGTTGDITTPRWSDKIILPFTFTFNGTNYDTIRAATSGVVTFTPSPATLPAFGNVLLPQATVPDNSVCILGLTTNWASGSNYARIVTKTFGTAPNRQYWVSFNSFGATTTTTSAFMTFSIMFEETTNKIFIVDQRVGNGTGLKLSMGIQIDAATAISVTGSPNVVNLSTISALSDDNAYYEFIAGTKPAFDLSVYKFDMPKYYAIPQAPFNVKGKIVNLGSTTITSMDVNYQVDGGNVITANLTGLNITAGAKYSFTHPTKWNPSSSGTYTINIWASNLNGNADQITGNDKVSGTAIVVDQMVQRLPLLEVFTSSTCGPCTAGNVNLHNVIGNHPGKYTVIKYQQDFPGTGDPYATTEAVNRRAFYGINSIPRMEIDGGWDKNASSFTEQILLDAYAVPSFLNITSTYSIWDQKVKVNVTLDPLTNLTSTNLKAFIAIYEKSTNMNVKSNGETEFSNVMKKMITNEQGISVGALTKGTPYNISRNYEFRGAYRLPIDGQAANRINHTKENSVEEFSDLGVIVWVQDYATKEVLQSTFATQLTDIENPAPGNGIISMYPNPVKKDAYLEFLLSSDKNVVISVYNMMGDLVVSEDKGLITSGPNVAQLNFSDYNQGMYILKLQIGDQVYTKKFIVE